MQLQRIARQEHHLHPRSRALPDVREDRPAVRLIHVCLAELKVPDVIGELHARSIHAAVRHVRLVGSLAAGSARAPTSA